MNFFKVYQPRKIEFRSLAKVRDWEIKIYSITFREVFSSTTVLHNALNKIPEWLEKTKSLEFETYKIAFLIVHEGRDGVWTLFNWWFGENMLQSVTFYTSFADTSQFKEMQQEGGMACVWELEVIGFERRMWVEHILKKAQKPDFTTYLSEHLDGEF